MQNARVALMIRQIALRVSENIELLQIVSVKQVLMNSKVNKIV